MSSGNLKNFSSAADSNMAFCGCVATPAILSAWSLSVVSGAVSAPVAVRGGWQSVRPCWSMRYCERRTRVSCVPWSASLIHRSHLNINAVRFSIGISPTNTDIAQRRTGCMNYPLYLKEIKPNLTDKASLQVVPEIRILHAISGLNNPKN